MSRGDKSGVPARARRKAALRLAGRRVFGYAFSRRCVMCGRATPLYQSGELCPDCVALYARSETRRCPTCGRDAARCACSQIRTQNLGAHPSALGFYFGSDDPVGRMIFSLKRDGARDLTRFFARSLAERIMKDLGTDASNALVTYPPRAVPSVWKYGFDHAKNLAREVARFLGADYARTLVRMGGAEQKKLGAAERALNVRDVFAPIPRREAQRNSVAGRRVILVDDVAATGATLAEAARVLLAAGAADVRFAVLFLAAARPRREDGLWFEEDGEYGDEFDDPLSDDVGF